MRKYSLLDKLNNKLNEIIIFIGMNGFFFLFFSIPKLFSSEPSYIFYQNLFFLLITILFGCYLLIIFISKKDILSKWKHKDKIYRIYYEMLIILTFAEILFITLFILQTLPFLYPSLDYINFIEPLYYFMIWLSLAEGIVIFTLVPLIYIRKRKLIQELQELESNNKK